MQLRNFILYSIVLHLLIVGAFLLTSKFSSKSDDSQAVEVTILEHETKTKLETPTLIVESDTLAANEKLNEKAKYLSEKTNSVEKETRAKTGLKFVNSQKQQLAHESKTQKKSSSMLFEKSFDAYGSLAKKMESEAQKALKGNGTPSTTNDNIKNASDDMITRLNTREYKYFGYYNRIKTQLNQWWVPKVQQKFTTMLRQGRSIASDENKITKLVIVLNTTGNLVRVQVLGESGVRDLDEAAIEAFRSAAPFPNPPKGMIESDGTVKIRWDCVVES